MGNRKGVIIDPFILYACFSKQICFNPQGSPTPLNYDHIFKQTYFNPQGLSPDDGNLHRYDLSIIDNFKKVKKNLKIALDFVQTQGYNIIKLKVRRKPKTQKGETT